MEAARKLKAEERQASREKRQQHELEAQRQFEADIVSKPYWEQYQLRQERIAAQKEDTMDEIRSSVDSTLTLLKEYKGSFDMNVN